jgi:hypothetical protein
MLLVLTPMTQSVAASELAECQPLTYSVLSSVKAGPSGSMSSWRHRR